LPFTHLRLAAPRRRVLAKGYPVSPRTLGDHLRCRRLERGLTQRTVAKTWGVRIETVSAWELGRARPSIRQVAKIIALLGGDPESVPEGLPGRLLAVRRRLGLTQAQLAMRLGQDEAQISRWESSRKRPHVWIAGRIDLTLRVLEGRPANELQAPLSFFDVTRWRRKPPEGMRIGPVTYGERLRAKRLDLGLTLEAVAKRAGTNRGTLYRLERDHQKPQGLIRQALDLMLSRASHLDPPPREASTVSRPSRRRRS
jgi:transcriptional regulator with XRE-family HTH domain